MNTKARLRFHARIAHYEADLELADVLSIAVNAGKLDSATRVFDGVVDNRHPRLANRLANRKNRTIAVGHLSNTLCASFIKDLHEDFSEYLSEVLHCCAKKGLDGNRLIGEHKITVEANVLLALGSWDAVVRAISDELFRKLEGERSTKKLLTAIDSKLSLKLDPTIRDAAIPYLDMRHILVHRDGIVDKEFCAKNKQMNLREGDAIPLGYNLAMKAKATIVSLIEHIDERVVQLNLIGLGDLQRPPVNTPSPK